MSRSTPTGGTLQVNGEAMTLHADETLAELIERLGYFSGFAVAVNDAFVPRGDYASLVLSSGDRVDIVRPMVGG